MTMLGAGCAAGVILAILYTIAGGREDWVLMAMALSQASISTLFLIAVVIFSQKTMPIEAIRRNSTKYLKEVLPSQIAEVRVPKKFGSFLDREIKVKVLSSVSYAATYNVYLDEISNTSAGLTTHLYLNLHRTAAFFYIPISDGRGKEYIEKIFSYEIEMSMKRFGFMHEAVVDKEEIGEGLYYVFCYLRDLREDFFESPAEQLAFAQDFAQLVRSFFMTMNRHNAKMAVIPAM